LFTFLKTLGYWLMSSPGVSSLGVRLVHGEKRGQEKDALGNLLNGRQHCRARYSVVDLLKHALEIEHRITSLH
jgi:hypothetical protein